MKCGIITVYNSLNCGSFLQAYALSKTLEKCRHENYILRRPLSDEIRLKIKRKVRYVASALRGGAFSNKIYRNFAMVYKILPIVRDKKNMSCYILGSDTIWDVSDMYFKRSWATFWGAHLKNAKIISYAPSMGFAKAEDIEKCDFIRDALHRMSAVSVRDETSKELLQPYCDKEIQVVCDPTYLLERAEYDAIAKPTDLKDFLFIYHYGKMPSDYKETIQRFAKHKGLKTVTFGMANPWCDVSLAYDPLLFLSLYNKAEYIITNTFHGTVFATIYEKRFAVIKNEKPKIQNVLKFCAMSDKMTNTAEDVSSILESDFCYEVTGQKILTEREKSLQFLKTAIEG